MAACQSSKGRKKNGKVPQYYKNMLEQACSGTNSKVIFRLKQRKKTDRVGKLICKGYINDVCVGTGCDDLKGKKAQEDCAYHIINSILHKKVVVEESVLKKLSNLSRNNKKHATPLPPRPFPNRRTLPKQQTGENVQKVFVKAWQNTKQTSAANVQHGTAKSVEQKVQSSSQTNQNIQTRETIPNTVSTIQQLKTEGSIEGNYPKIPECNLGFKMLCRMGWRGGGLGKKGNKGIEEPITIKNVYGRQGLSMPHQRNTPQCKQNKKQTKERTEPIITHKFIKKFVMSDKNKIVVTERLIDEDHRLLQKLCPKNQLCYEFAKSSKHLVIRKPFNWAEDHSTEDWAEESSKKDGKKACS